MSRPLLVLAGGLGTRLRSVVSEVPKPLAPVLGKPFLSYLIDSWRRQGQTEFVFLLHHMSDIMEVFLAEKFGEPGTEDCVYSTVLESHLLGTGGSVANALNQTKISGDFYVANSDTWLPGTIDAMGDFEAPAVCVVEVKDCSRYGAVVVSGQKVRRFREKSKLRAPGEINAGFYLLRAKDFAGWDGKPMSLESVVLPKLAMDNHLYAAQMEGLFIDIGVPSDYQRFCIQYGDA